MEPGRGVGKKKPQPLSCLCRPLGLRPPRGLILHPPPSRFATAPGAAGRAGAAPGRAAGLYGATPGPPRDHPGTGCRSPSGPPQGHPGTGCRSPSGPIHGSGAAASRPPALAASSRRPRTAPRQRPPALPPPPHPTSPRPASRGLVLGCPHPKIARALHPQGKAGDMLGRGRGDARGAGYRTRRGERGWARSPVPRTVRLPQALPAPGRGWSITWCSLPAV